MNSTDVMLDLETTGVAPGCGILTIGATTFNKSHTFYQKIMIESCEEVGLLPLASTMAWWDQRPTLVREEAFSGVKSLQMVLGEFSDWWQSLPGREKFCWGNGADFDLPILRAAYKAVDMECPVAPFNARCYRTLKNLFKEIKAPVIEGFKHHALADAIYQADHASAILRYHFNRI